MEPQCKKVLHTLLSPNISIHQPNSEMKWTYSGQNYHYTKKTNKTKQNKQTNKQKTRRAFTLLAIMLFKIQNNLVGINKTQYLFFCGVRKKHDQHLEVPFAKKDVYKFTRSHGPARHRIIWVNKSSLQVVNVVFSIYRLLPVKVKGHRSKVTGIVGNSRVTWRGQAY